MTRVNSNDVCDWLIFILTRMLCWQSVLCQLLISRKVKHNFPKAKIWFEFQLNDVIPLSSTAWNQPCRIPVSEEGRGQMILIHLIVSALICFSFLMISICQVDSDEALEAGEREAALRGLDREVPGLSGIRAEVKRLRSGSDDYLILTYALVYIH